MWDLIGLCFYFVSLVFILIVWSTLPDKVPGHFNVAGEVDRWGSKWELIILPIIGALLYIFMMIFEKHPETHNYPNRLNENNREQFYLNSRKMLNQTKNICMIVFSVLTFEMVSIALGWWGGLGIWSLPILIIGVMFPIIRGIVKQKKIK